MAAERIIGVVLLIAGLGLIAYTLFLSFTFFTGQVLPPEIFNIEETGLQVSLENISPENFQDAIPQLLESLLPQDTFPQMLNLVIWSVFAGVLIFAGAQIAGLVIRLMKP